MQKLYKNNKILFIHSNFNTAEWASFSALNKKTHNKGNSLKSEHNHLSEIN